MDDQGSIGERIRYYRKRRGLTQEVLAGRVGRSESWLTKVERGELVMDRISTLLLLANVLKVEPGALVGGVSLPPNGGAPHDPPRGVIGLRRAVVAVRPPDREPPGADDLRTAVERVHGLRAAGSFKGAVALLPEVLAAARAAVAQEVPGASWSLSAAYRIATRLLLNLGERDVALIAADRAVAAAHRSGDILAAAAATRQIAFALLSLGLVDEAAGVCSDGGAAVAPGDASPPERWSLWGSLRLTEAVTVARAGDAVEPWRLVRDARTAAERVGSGRDDYWEAFGPANVGAHEVAVALELGDAVEALRLADTVDVEELPYKSRRVRFCVDVAHAHALRRDDGATVLLLLEAERHSAEMLAHTMSARELVRVCLRRERKSRTPGLRALAQRIGVAQ